MTNIGIKPSMAKADFLNNKLQSVPIINIITKPDTYFLLFSISSAFNFFIIR